MLGVERNVPAPDHNIVTDDLSAPPSPLTYLSEAMPDTTTDSAKPAIPGVLPTLAIEILSQITNHISHCSHPACFPAHPHIPMNEAGPRTHCRDLRSLALTCRRLRSIYLPRLLHSVCFYGSSSRSITIPMSRFLAAFRDRPGVLQNVHEVRFLMSCNGEILKTEDGPKIVQSTMSCLAPYARSVKCYQSTVMATDVLASVTSSYVLNHAATALDSLSFCFSGGDCSKTSLESILKIVMGLLATENSAAHQVRNLRLGMLRLLTGCDLTEFKECLCAFLERRPRLENLSLELSPISAPMLADLSDLLVNVLSQSRLKSLTWTSDFRELLVPDQRTKENYSRLANAFEIQAGEDVPQSDWPWLSSLHLGGSNLDVEVAEQLSIALRDDQGKLSRVESLTLKRSGLGDLAFMNLAPAIAGRSSIKSLDLSGNVPHADGMCALQNALFGTPESPNPSQHIETLNLSNLNLTAYGVRPIAEGLRVTTALRSLDMSSCNMDDEGALFLASGLESNSTLTALNLSNNQFTDIGLIAIAKAVGSKPYLSELNLSDLRQCRSDAGYLTLIRAWTKMFVRPCRPAKPLDPAEIGPQPMLKMLNFSENFWTDYAWDGLADLMPVMRRLELVNLKGAVFSFAGFDGPLELMKSLQRAEKVQKNVNERFVLLYDTS
ncbi:hypothetical protein BJ742DRAFT_799539 [Cladochytrium replicatum]|nr:hypothetical protein BJ742DRAFT_799539 [Cladochytrium replicatum]